MKLLLDTNIPPVTHDLKPSVAQVRASILHANQDVDLIATALSRLNDDLKRGAILSEDIKNARLPLLPL